jgi:hypothetical protein
LILPSEIVVSLRGPDRRAIPDVLVALHFQWHGHFYYAHSFGLSDGRGQVSASGDEILKTFHSEQAKFPMDLKVPLAECDAEVIVNIMGDGGFLEHRRSLTPGWVTSEWMERWNRAQNGRYQAHDAPLTLNSPTPVQLIVELQLTGDSSDARAV